MTRSSKLIKKAREEVQEESYYRLWLVRYPQYTEDNYESFQEFYEENKPKIIISDNRSKDEIMEELINITPTREEED